jgi:phosphinothricin acetyltransferase
MSERTGVRAAAHPSPVEIRAATEGDLPQIVEIMNYTAANSIANFATRPTSVAERRDWFAQFSSTGPYRLFVARRGDVVLGYAGSQRYRDHEAFRETVEASIGLHVSSRRQGMGTLLYRALFDCLADEPVHVVLAGIAMPNEASVALHRKFGFTEVGTFREYAVKNGQYLSSLWLQRLSIAAGSG